MMSVTVENIWPFALLAGLPLVWWLALRNRTGIGRERMLGATVLRSLALAAIATALLDPTLRRTTDDLSVVYVVDVSRSVSRHFLNEALDWIGQIHAQHRPAQSRAVVFADNAICFFWQSHLSIQSIQTASPGQVHNKATPQYRSGAYLRLYSCIGNL